MSLKEWVTELPDGFHIVARRELKRGVIVEFSVVLIFNDQCICRYDTAHGKSHKDILGKKGGLISKEWYETIPKNEVFKHAIQDFKTNYKAHLFFFHLH
jgi:hypothetical protein